MAATAKQIKEIYKNRDYVGVTEAFCQGADPDAMTDFIYDTSCTMLYLAVYNNDPALMDILLAAGADPNKGTESSAPMWRVVEEGYFSFVVRLTQAEGFDPNAPGNQRAWARAEKRQNESPCHAQVFRFLQNIYDPDNGCGWHKIDEASIQHVSRTPDHMTEIATIFNFRAAKMKEITRDYATGRSDVESTYFADLPQNARGQVLEALTELQKQDGGQDVDPRSLSGVRHIQRNRSKQVQKRS